MNPVCFQWTFIEELFRMNISTFSKYLLKNKQQSTHKQNSRQMNSFKTLAPFPTILLTKYSMFSFDF
jgi:hypothetical protein